MAKSKLMLIVILIAVIILNIMCVVAATVTLISPNGGECLRQGSTVTITWTQSAVDHAALYYSTDGGATVPDFGDWFFMFDSGDSSTSYDWSVPANINSDSVRIWVEGHDAGHKQRLAIYSSNSNLMIKPSCTQPDTAQPTVSIDSPTNGATLYGQVVISAAASDNTGVAGVQFRLDSQNLGPEDTASPYSAALDTTAIADGTHAITAIARDAAGNTAASSVSVTVSNADTTPPTISSLSSSSVTASGATLTWTTNELSDMQVDYGASTNYGYSSTIDATLMTSHSITLSGLNAGATYHYRVKSRDSAGNLATSNDFTFTTVIPDTTPPLLSNGLPAGILAAGTTSATISLTTNKAATCKYSTSPNIAYNLMSNTFEITGGTLHSKPINGLTNGTFNYYARCIDASGNLNSNDFIIRFTITNPPSADILTISSPSSSVTASGATITWATSKNSDSQIEYGTATSYGASTAIDPLLVTSHSQTLSGLLASTLYHYRVKSRDTGGNIAASDDFTFITLGIMPKVSITSPAGDAIVSGTIEIAAKANNAEFYGIQFKLDGNNLGLEDTAPPYTLSWDTIGSTNGKHTLAAFARGIDGSFESSQLSITISNLPQNNGAKPILDTISTESKDLNGIQIQETVNANLVSLKLGRIDAGSSVALPINSASTAVKKITFEVKSSVTGAEFEIEDLVTNPVNVPPSKNVYKYLQLTKTDLLDISKATIQFKVPLSWIKNNNIKENEIVLFHYENKMWKSLPTVKVGVEGADLLYQATTMGFSAFAIGVKDASPVESSQTEQLSGEQLQKSAEQNTLLDIEEENSRLYWIYLLSILLPTITFLGFFQFRMMQDSRRERTIIKLRTYINTNLKRGYTLQQIRYTLIKYNIDNEDIEEATRTLSSVIINDKL